MTDSGKMQLNGNLLINATSDGLSKQHGNVRAPVENVINSFRGTRHRRWVVPNHEEMSASHDQYLLKLLRSTDESNRPRFSLHPRNSRRRRGPAVDVNTLHRRDSNSRPDVDFSPIHSKNSNSHLSANISVQDRGKDEDLIEDWLKVLVEGDVSSDTDDKAITASLGHKNHSPQEQTAVKTKQRTTPRSTRKTTSSRITEVSPAYPCDQWDAKSRTCWSVRAVGDAITFSLALDGDLNVPPSFQVLWTKHYHIRHMNHAVVEKINPDEPPWNMAVGKRGLELRISPITDDDLDLNKFVASVWKLSRHPHHRRLFKKVNFRIDITPIDLGYVYVGEHITISIERYATLPPDSMIFDWQLEGEGGMVDLYSNMAVSRTRRVLHIKELRKQQEGFISCFMYTDIGVFVSKRRFYVHELNNEMLTGNKDAEGGVINTMEVRIPRNLKGDSFYENLYEPESDYSGLTADTEKLSDMSGDVQVHNKEDEVGYRKHALAGENFRSRQDSLQQEKMYYHAYRDSNAPFHNYHPNMASRRGRMNSDLSSNMNFKGDNSLTHEIVPAMENYAALQNSGQLNGPMKSGSNFSVFKPNFVSEEKNYGHILSPKTEGPEGTMQSDLLVFHLDTDDESAEVDIKESLLISRCLNDRQCSSHANCVQLKLNQSGHCECVHGYRGNGIFCWEHMDFMPPLEVPLIPKQDYTSSDESPIRSLNADERHNHQERDSLQDSSLMTQEFSHGRSSVKVGLQPNIWNNFPQQQSSSSKQESNHPHNLMNGHQRHIELPQVLNNYKYSGEELRTHSSSGRSRDGEVTQEGSSEEMVEQR